MKKIENIIIFIFSVLGVTSLSKQVDIFNSLQNPIYINNQPSTVRLQIPEKKKTGKFTLTGFFKVDNFQTIPLNILRIYNDTHKKKKNVKKFNSLYPICPYSFNFLEKFPQYKNDYNIKNNPNCFLNEVNQDKDEGNNNRSLLDDIEKVCSVDIENENDSVFLNFQFPQEFIENEKSVKYNFEKFLNLAVEINKWTFFAVSFDYEGNRGKALIEIFNDQQKNDVFQQEFELKIQNFGLQENFSIYYSENKQIETYDNLGLIYDVNFYYQFFDNLTLLSLFNYDEHFMKTNNLILDFTFEDTRTNRNVVFSQGDKKKEFYIDGNFFVQNKGGVNFKDAIIKLGSILKDYPDTLIKSPTFFFSFKILDNLEKNKEKNNTQEDEKIDLLNMEMEKSILNKQQKNILIKNEEKNNLQKEEIKNGDSGVKSDKIILLETEDGFFSISAIAKEDYFFLELEIKKGEKENFIYQSELKFQKENLMELGIVLYFTDVFFEFYIFYDDKKYEKSPHFFFDINKLLNSDFNLSSKKNISFSVEIDRFLILNIPLPFVMSLQTTINEEDCKTFLIPNVSDNNICLNCKDSVLNLNTKKCQKFCESGQKNIGGVCVNCFEKNCKELEHPSLLITGKSDKEFSVKLTDNLFKKTLKELKEELNIGFDPFVNATTFNYTFGEINDNELALQILSKNSFYNTTLKININQNILENMYTENREKIEKLEGVYFIKKISEVFPENKSGYLDFIVYTIVTIFWFILLFGIVIFFFKFKYEFNDFSFKKFYFIFVNIQLFILLLFLAVDLPHNMKYVLNKIYSHTFRYFGTHSLFLKISSKENLIQPTINFYKNDFSYLLIDNFAILILLHFAILVMYLIIKILILFNRIKTFSTNSRERLFKINEVLEFNPLIVSFSIFSIPIFAFSILNLVDFNKETFFITTSLVISFIYIILFIISFITFCMLYMFNSGFRQYTLFKCKFDFLFLGYNDNKFSNLYEILEILLNCLIGAVLTGVSSNKSTQLILLFFLIILKLLIFSFIKPYLENWDKLTEFLVRVTWIVFFLLLSLLAFFNSEIIGYILLTMFIIMILFEFVSNLIFVAKYFVNIKQNGSSYPGNLHFQKLSTYNQNSLIDINQTKNSFNTIKSNYYEDQDKLKNKKSSDFSKNPNLDKSIRSNIENRKSKIDLEDLKSGTGKLHDSYLSHDSKSYDDKDNIKF